MESEPFIIFYVNILYVITVYLSIIYYGCPVKCCIDIEQCRHCDGEMKIIAAIEDPAIIVKILKHLGLPTRAPPCMITALKNNFIR